MAMQGFNAVVGLGASGFSALAYLRAAGLEVVALDSRDAPPALPKVRAQYPDVEVRLGEFDASLLRAAARIVLSPGISVHEPVVAAAARAGVPVVGDIELFAQAVARPVIAITGSNGKSTVTALVGEMLRHDGRVVAVGGNIGTPALDLLPSRAHGARADAGEPEVYVLELSSFQLETTYSLSPAVAVFLNVSADHMDRYDALEDYVGAKARIFHRANTAVVNDDDAHVVTAAHHDLPANAALIGYTAGVPAPGHYGLVESSDGRTWLAAPAAGGQHTATGEGAPTEPVVAADEITLVGRHNWSNGLAALAVADAMGVSRLASIRALQSFSGLAHRCELVARRAGVSWVNDSKGTNVGATLAAIEGLGGRGNLVLIAGGDGKGADFAPLAEALRGRARALILLGRDGPALGAAVGTAAPQVIVASMHEAVVQAERLAEPGDVVALSPACASWDMYPNYQVRGEDFAREVEALGPGPSAL